MKRIQVFYDGIEYSIGNRSILEVRDQITAAVAGGKPEWLEVNHGDGRLDKTWLLLGPGVGISLIEFPPDSGEPEAAGQGHH